MNASFIIAIRRGEVIQPAVVARPTGTGPWSGHWRGWSGSFRRSARSLCALRAQLRQGTQSREVVGRHGQRQQLIDFIQPLHRHLADRADELAPAEALLD